MKDFLKVFLLLLGVLLFYVILYYMSGIHPMTLRIVGIVLSTAVIVWAIYFLGKRKSWRHKPQEDEDK